MNKSMTLAGRIKSLDQLSDLELSQLVSGGPTSLLVGSAVSIWEPTNLPSGQQVSGELFETIFNDAERHWGAELAYKIRRHYNDLPFERIMERCRDRNALRQVIKLLFDTTTYNPLHQLLAKILLQGTIESIVTTNYDCCIDKAIRSLAECNSWELMPVIRRIVEPTLQRRNDRSSNQVLRVDQKEYRQCSGWFLLHCYCARDWSDQPCPHGHL